MGEQLAEFLTGRSDAASDSFGRLSDLGGRKRPSGMARHQPDRFLPRLSRLTVAPTDAALRAEFVRHCMSLFCRRRGYKRLAGIFSSAPVEYCKSGSYLKSLFLVITNEHYLDEGDHLKMLSVVYTEVGGSVEDISPEFLRLANIASDVLQWDDRDVESIESEYVQYVQPAWLVLCDELEYETEESASDSYDPSDAYYDHIEAKAVARTKAGAKAQADADTRTYPSDAEHSMVRLEKVLSTSAQLERQNSVEKAMKVKDFQRDHR